ncbi:MAG: hypothetical protein RID81_07080 [Sandaracinaceae bacterium]
METTLQSAMRLITSCCGETDAPETPDRLRLDADVYAALREELGVARLPRKVRAEFEARLCAGLRSWNRQRSLSRIALAGGA